MDENFNGNSADNNQNLDNNTSNDTQGDFNNINGQNDRQSRSGNFIRRFFMDNRGKIKADNNGTATAAASTRTFIVLGWICAALTVLVSSLFAIGGIIFGILVNREARGSGNAVIITNIVLAAINLIFGLYFMAVARRMMFGY